MKNNTVVVSSISEMHRVLMLPAPEHPLISVINFDHMVSDAKHVQGTFLYDVYCICIKKNFKGKMRYGQQYYDFDEGMMSFFSPGQLISTEKNNDLDYSGWFLTVHPDFLRNYPLYKTIRNYGFFSYAVAEALHLSGKEEEMITNVIENISQEYRSMIDNFSQDVIVAQLELLLTYCNRFYNRQFITRKVAGNDVLIKLENLLTEYFNNDQQQGLPTVQYISDQLNLSPNYLSDMLRSLTGQSTQQHIHNKLIDKAKEILTTTSLSVGEIAYQLGFEYPQSFNKLFKSKTNVSPLAFRNSFPG
jgi:AraC family transcriptional regulator, transcriptional activator of pobA